MEKSAPGTLCRPGSVGSGAYYCGSGRGDRKFKPQEYWSIDAKLLGKASRKAFAAKLYGKDKKISIKTKEEADAILKELEGCDYVVENVKKSVRKKSPAPPFTTSTLQQEASRSPGFSGKTYNESGSGVV